MPTLVAQGDTYTMIPCGTAPVGTTEDNGNKRGAPAPRPQ